MIKDGFEYIRCKQFEKTCVHLELVNGTCKDCIINNLEKENEKLKHQIEKMKSDNDFMDAHGLTPEDAQSSLIIHCERCNIKIMKRNSFKWNNEYFCQQCFEDLQNEELAE